MRSMRVSIPLAATLGVMFSGSVGAAFADRRKWIFEGRGHPQPSLCIEGNIHRLFNVRLACKQLDLKTRWQNEPFQLLRCRSRFSSPDVLLKSIAVSFAVVTWFSWLTGGQGNNGY